MNVSVRVNSPGDNGPVDQRNTSSATAVAAGNPPVGAGGSGAAATSTSSQVGPANLNVSVRVGSPGADASRTQVNSSSATSALADPATVAPTLGTLPDPNSANSASEVDNESAIIQSLAQCGGTDDETGTDTDPSTDTCPDPSTATSAAAGSPAQAAGTSHATATQHSPTNIDVSIRVGSPGDGGLATQLNSARANGGTSVSTITTPTNLVVSVVVPGAPGQVAIPSGDSPWIWNWSWTTGQAPTDPSAADTSTGSWEWTWTAPLEPAPDTTTAAAQPQSGSWTWTWNWTRPDGTTTTWTYSQACSCSWAWTWSWNWPASTTSTAPAAPQPTTVAAPPSNPAVSQTNESSATAVALTTFTGSQTAAETTDGAAPTTIATGQGIVSEQDATASADVAQTRPLNESIVTAGEIDGLRQGNRLAATAIATAYDEVNQSLKQTQAGTDDGASHSLSAVQQVETLQSVHADVAAGQTDARNINQVWSVFGPSKARLGKVTQQNTAETLAIADVESAVRQVIEQSQTGGGADQDASAIQVAITTQAQSASSRVSQARVTNRNAVAIPLNGVSNPALDQSNSVSAVSASYAGSTIDQSALQSESGDGIEWHATGRQEATVKQSGAASSAASQSDRTNSAGWNGITATPGAPASLRSAGASGPPAGFVAFAASPEPVVEAPIRELTLRVSPVAAPKLRKHPKHRAFTSRHPRISRPAITHSTASAIAGPWATSLAGSTAKTSRSRPSAGSRGGTTSPPLPKKHDDLNLLGTLSTAPPALLSAGFAALLAPIRLAAPGVGRLQRNAPALGRPADTALRERPG